MNRRWPLGPEVQRTPVERGVMLYDSSRAGNLSLQWFDVHYWESQNAVEGTARGRGQARFIKTGGLKLVLRPYRRGGLVARLLTRGYFWTGEERTRPFREWLLTYRMHRAGLPVAAPIGAHFRRRFGFYRGEILTERLAVKGTLADCLMQEPLSVLTWVAIGRCVRRFHDFGVCHADLNVRNILVGEADDQVYLIDFDRCTLRRRGGLWRDSNLVRLRRSLEKVTYGLPRERFTESDWHALLDGYRSTPDAAASIATEPLAFNVPASPIPASPIPPGPVRASPVSAPPAVSPVAPASSAASPAPGAPVVAADKSAPPAPAGSPAAAPGGGAPAAPPPAPKSAASAPPAAAPAPGQPKDSGKDAAKDAAAAAVGPPTPRKESAP